MNLNRQQNHNPKPPQKPGFNIFYTFMVFIITFMVVWMRRGTLDFVAFAAAVLICALLLFRFRLSPSTNNGRVNITKPLMAVTAIAILASAGVVIYILFKYDKGIIMSIFTRRLIIMLLILFLLGLMRVYQDKIVAAINKMTGDDPGKKPANPIMIFIIAAVIWAMWPGHFGFELLDNASFPAETTLAKACLGESAFRQGIFFEDGTLGDITEIQSFRYHNTRDTLAIMGRRKAVLLDDKKNVVKKVMYSYTGASPAGIMGPDRDGEPYFLLRGSWLAPVELHDKNGWKMWSYNDPGGINDSSVGDVNNDGAFEVAVGFNGTGGIRLLDMDGRLLWQKEERNVWQTEITAYNGQECVVHSNKGGYLVTRDKNGGAVNTSRYSCYDSFALIDWFDASVEKRVAVADAARVFILSLKGEVLKSFLHDGFTAHNKTCACTFGKEYLAVLLNKVGGPSELYIYRDSEAENPVYQAEFPTECGTIANYKDTVLVGGKGVVYQFAPEI